MLVSLRGQGVELLTHSKDCLLILGLCAGTTITAVHELEKAGVRAAFINAVLSAADKSEQLAKL